MELLKISSTTSRIDDLMSDKFVVNTNEIGRIIVTDVETGNVYHYGSMSNFLGLIRLLNEQQSTINRQTEQHKARLDKLIEEIGELQMKNVEQQATIKSKDKQLERLYNYFQYYLKDEMSGNAFSEMWDFVKEDEEWEDE